MNRGRQILHTMAGISLAAFLFAAAMILPGYINAVIDKRILDHPVSRDINMEAYEISYSSFVEKLHAVARCNHDESIYIEPVRKKGQRMEEGKITKIAQKEMNRLMERNPQWESVALKADQLVSWKSFTLYGSAEGKYISGFHFWKITYRQKGRRVTLYMDEEYHKIYTIQVRRVYDMPKNGFTGVNAGIGLRENIYEWIAGAQRYYGLEHCRSHFNLDSLDSTWYYANVFFEDDTYLYCGTQYEREWRKNKLICRSEYGIQIEKMLQV